MLMGSIRGSSKSTLKAIEQCFTEPNATQQCVKFYLLRSRNFMASCPSPAQTLFSGHGRTQSPHMPQILYSPHKLYIAHEIRHHLHVVPIPSDDIYDNISLQRIKTLWQWLQFPGELVLQMMISDIGSSVENFSAVNSIVESFYGCLRDVRRFTWLILQQYKSKAIRIKEYKKANLFLKNNAVQWNESDGFGSMSTLHTLP